MASTLRAAAVDNSERTRCAGCRKQGFRQRGRRPAQVLDRERSLRSPTATAAPGPVDSHFMGIIRRQTGTGSPWACPFCNKWPGLDAIRAGMAQPCGFWLVIF